MAAFLPSLRPCICFIIESPIKTVVNDLSALLGGIQSFTESSWLRGSKRFWWFTCWGESRGFCFFVFSSPETFLNWDLWSLLNCSERDIGLSSDNFNKSFETICKAVLKESLSSVSFFAASISWFNLVFKMQISLFKSCLFCFKELMIWILSSCSLIMSLSSESLAFRILISDQILSSSWANKDFVTISADSGPALGRSLQVWWHAAPSSSEVSRRHGAGNSIPCVPSISWFKKVLQLDELDPWTWSVPVDSYQFKVKWSNLIVFLFSLLITFHAVTKMKIFVGKLNKLTKSASPRKFRLVHFKIFHKTIRCNIFLL